MVAIDIGDHPDLRPELSPHDNQGRSQVVVAWQPEAVSVGDSESTHLPLSGRPQPM